MEDTNDTSAVAADTQDDTKTAPVVAPEEQKPDRPKLTDEEQLAVLEGRAQRLRTKLGKEEPAKQASAPDELLQKAYLRSASITAEDEVELALSTAKKWGLPIDKLVDDEDFKVKLDKLRTQKANEAATTEIKGGPGSKGAIDNPDYYVQRGTPPTPSEVPNRKERAAIVRKMVEKSASGGKTFYSD